MELMYPLSSGYVQDWTATRALAELVANALDEDPKATLTWDQNRAVITDRGPGWPEEALVMGYTTKNDSQIGQFGEGAKLAMLVLCRELGPDAVTVTTAGFTLTPRLEKRTLGITTRKADSGSAPSEGLELLIVTTEPNRKRRGTTITVECAHHQYLAVKARFRQFDNRRYTQPDTPGVVVPGLGGRIYIGGVMLRDDVDCALSYDFSLRRAKHLQNRDRTVIDGWALRSCINDVLEATLDRDAIERFCIAALTGNTGQFEDMIPAPPAAGTNHHRAWKAVGRKLFRDTKPFWVPDGQEELELSLIDNGWKKISSGLRTSGMENLMARLGVPTANTAIAVKQAKPVWVNKAHLDAEDRRDLNRAIRVGRKLFGVDAIGRVRVYSSHPGVGDRWDGFFDPQNGDIALHIDVLGDAANLRCTLAHEMAHRRAWARGDEHADRTRSFEQALSELAAAALAPKRRPTKTG